MLGKLVLAVAVLGLCAGWAGAAHAGGATAAPRTASSATVAREHYERGTKFYDIGRYDEAIREFEAAYEAKSDPAFIYNLAQAHRLAGHNQEALQLYRNYLRYVPYPPNRTDIDERIRALEKAVAERPSSAPSPTPVQPGPPPASTTPPAPIAGTPPPATYPTPAAPGSPGDQPNGAQAGYPAPGQPEGVGAGPPQQPPLSPDYGVVAQAPPGPQPPAAAPRSSRKKVGIVIGAIGGAFLVGGAVSGIVAWSASNSVQKAAENGEAFDPSVENTGRAAAVLQWVGYGIGAAGVAAGLILIATSPSGREGAPAPVAALPIIGPGLGGAAMRMTF